jgi:Periplasmic binding protein
MLLGSCLLEEQAKHQETPRVVMLLSTNKRKLKVPVFLCLCLLLVACGAETSPPAPTQSGLSQPRDQTGAQSYGGPDQQDISNPVGGASGEKIKVAIMLPLSGTEAATGQALLRAAVIALFDAYDPRIILLPYDTKADPDETERLAHRAVDEGVSIVLGPLLATNLDLAGAILEPAHIPLIGFSNDSSVAAPGRFIMGFLPETEVKRVVDFAASKGLLEQAALIPEGRYGARVRAAFGDAATAAGATIAAIENYPPDPDAVFEPVKRLSNYDERRKDMRDEIRFLRSLGDDLTDEIANQLSKSEVLEGITYEALLLPEGGELLGTLAPLLPFYEIDPNKVKLLGTGLWNDPGLLREPPLQGAWFAAPHPVAPNAFLKRQESNFGKTPPRIATLAYDAMSLVALLARTPAVESPGDPQKPKITASLFAPERLLRETGFSGLDGLFRFLADGTVERSLAVLEINRRGLQVIDPAPTAFPSFGYALRQPASQE